MNLSQTDDQKFQLEDRVENPYRLKQLNFFAIKFFCSDMPKA